MVKLTINNKTIDYELNKDLFVNQKETGVFIAASCYKKGLCKECIIKIEKGTEFLNKPTVHENHLKAPYRLACQAKIIIEGDVKCSTLKRDAIVIEESTSFNEFHISDKTISPQITKDKYGNVLLNNKQIDNTSNEILGLVIDIGTTTVVLKSINLNTGQTIKIVSFENPQRFAGSNVMSRIQYDIEDKTKQLRRILNSYIYNAIRSLTQEPRNIYHVLIGGNTAMRDIYFGMDVKTLGLSPYVSISEIDFNNNKTKSTALESTGKKMKLPIHPNGLVYSIPIIGNHIGSDISAGLLTVDFHKKTDWHVYIDIGTNTEIVIGNKEIAFAASSPSGPAFEGGGITFGMPALSGAIERVTINNKKVTLNVIGDKKPIGICGSGLIDILGELKKNNIINSTGRFIGEYEDKNKFYLDVENDIFITEYDINQLALAKGSNSSALQILLNKCGICINDVKKYYVAGGFGKHIDIDQAKSIGMLPNVDNSKIEQIGNACIKGLTIELLDKTKQSEIENFVKKITTVNLETEESFFDYFVSGCLFNPIGQKQNEHEWE